MAEFDFGNRSQGYDSTAAVFVLLRYLADNPRPTAVVSNEWLDNYLEDCRQDISDAPVDLAALKKTAIDGMARVGIEEELARIFMSAIADDNVRYAASRFNLEAGSLVAPDGAGLIAAREQIASIFSYQGIYDQVPRVVERILAFGAIALASRRSGSGDLRICLPCTGPGDLAKACFSSRASSRESGMSVTAYTFDARCYVLLSILRLLEASPAADSAYSLEVADPVDLPLAGNPSGYPRASKTACLDHVGTVEGAYDVVLAEYPLFSVAYRLHWNQFEDMPYSSISSPVAWSDSMKGILGDACEDAIITGNEVLLLRAAALMAPEGVAALLMPIRMSYGHIGQKTRASLLKRNLVDAVIELRNDDRLCRQGNVIWILRGGRHGDEGILLAHLDGDGFARMGGDDFYSNIDDGLTDESGTCGAAGVLSMIENHEEIGLVSKLVSREEILHTEDSSLRYTSYASSIDTEGRMQEAGASWSSLRSQHRESVEAARLSEQRFSDAMDMLD